MGMFVSAAERSFARNIDYGQVAHDRSGDPGDRAKLWHSRDADRRNAAAPASGQATRQRSVLADLLAPCGDARAEQYSERLLKAFGSLGRVFTASPEALDRAAGGAGVGSMVTAARHAYQEALREGVKGSHVDSADPRLHRFLIAQLGMRADEQSHAVYIDSRGDYIADETVASGASAEVPLRCRTLFQRALTLEASGILLAHNHPSGNAAASPADIASTRELVRIAGRLELTIVDHLIVTARQVFSMKRAGLL